MLQKANKIQEIYWTNWTNDEHEKFIKAMRLYGKNWTQIAEYMGTRN